MKTLMIVARASMMSELETLLNDTGITAYSVINKVLGQGKTGKVYESIFDPGHTGFNLMIFVVLPSDHVDRAVNALKVFHAAHVKGPHGAPIPFKLFSFPCEELI